MRESHMYSILNLINGLLIELIEDVNDYETVSKYIDIIYKLILQLSNTIDDNIDYKYLEDKINGFNKLILQCKSIWSRYINELNKFELMYNEVINKINI